MIYLTKQDILTYIEEDQLGIISRQSDATILRAEMAAKEEMASYLSARYDVDKVFIEVPNWAAGTYNEGQFVNYQPNANAEWAVYRAKENTNAAPSDNTKWELRDDRNAIVVMFLADITVYHLFTAINPRNIPELRGIRYEAAVAWLNKVQKMQANPNLPKLQEADFVPQVKFGSNPPRSNQF